MKNNIKLLYNHLINNNKQSLYGWYNRYKTMVENTAQVKAALNLDPNLTLGSVSVFENTNFENIDKFLRVLFANTSNGVASNGQSVFSDTMHEIALNNEDFVSSLTRVLRNPADEWKAFGELWGEIFPQNNPVQINRVISAATTSVTTTVDSAKFMSTFKWLFDKDYITEELTGKNWLEKNLYLAKYLKEEFKEELNDKKKFDVDEYWLNIFVWEVYENMANPFSLKKQIVKYGSPGTGKTYIAKKIAQTQFNVWKNTVGENIDLKFEDACDFVQFHPSYSYEDFIEGLRPKLVDGMAQLQLTNGVFKMLCKKASLWEVDIFNWAEQKLIKRDLHKGFETITVNDLKDVSDKEKHWNILEGAKPEELIKDLIPPFFMVIDEINRAELSRVFGELMYCMEYRGVNGAIKTQYASLNNKETAVIQMGSGYKFFIPNNVFIIASMNTIDRSVDSFDFALRRRFKWEEVRPNYELLTHHLETNYKQWSSISKNLKKLNEAIEIESLLGKDFCIGHAYLWNLNYAKEMTPKEVRKSLWNDSIGSLLEEYLRGTGKESLVNEFKNKFGV